MYSFRYVSAADGSDSSLVIVSSEGEDRVVGPSHPNFDRLYDFLVMGESDEYFDTYEEEEEWLLEQAGNAVVGVSKALSSLSDRVSFDGDYIYFDASKMDNNLSRHLVRMIREGNNDYKSLVNFMEKLAENPSPLSRIHLFTWMNGRNFTITPDGDLVGYKAVQDTADNKSIHGGTNTVYVDGVAHTGNIPNPIGSVVQIAREEVNPDRQVLCSYGLHVATHEYASWFGSGRNILTVAVNPRDVVSVPNDHSDQKMRVCRYVVLEVSGKDEIQSTTLNVTVPDTNYFNDNVIFPDDEEGNIY